MKKGDWIIHAGRSTRGDGSYTEEAVKLIGETKDHYIIESLVIGEPCQGILLKEEWPRVVLASDKIVEATRYPFGKPKPKPKKKAKKPAKKKRRA